MRVLIRRCGLGTKNDGSEPHRDVILNWSPNCLYCDVIVKCVQVLFKVVSKLNYLENRKPRACLQ